MYAHAQSRIHMLEQNHSQRSKNFFMSLVLVTPPVHSDVVENRNFFEPCEQHVYTTEPHAQVFGAVVPAVHLIICDKVGFYFVSPDRTGQTDTIS